MTSRTRKNKTRVLIAFGKGIASTLALELAMLFCHAGTEVKAAFIDNAGEWLTEAPIKQISGHSVLTADKKPSWYFSEQRFSATMVISPSSLSQQQICNGASNDPIIEYIINSSPIIQVLQTKQLMPGTNTYNPLTLSFYEIPGQPAQLRPVFHKLFADCTARLAALKQLQQKTFQLHYSLPEQLKKTFADLPLWVHRLERAILQAGLRNSDPKATATDLFIQAYDGPAFEASGGLCHAGHASTPPASEGLCVSFIPDHVPETSIAASDQNIFIKRLSNGLKIFDGNGTRLLPDITGQCAFSRLATYLTTLLQKIPQPACAS